MSLQDTTKVETSASDAAQADAKPASAAPTPVKDATKAVSSEDAQDGKKDESLSTPKASASASIFDDDDDDTNGDEAAKSGQDDGTGESGADADPVAPTAWAPPDDWRERIANGDDKYLAELKRFASWDTWLKSQRTLRAKMSSGELKRADSSFDDAWDDAKKTEWRKANGIPEKPDGYDLPEVKSKEWTDADRLAMAPLLEGLHAKNVQPGVVQDVLSYYADALALAQEHRVNQDREHKIHAEDALRKDWGPDYRANINLIKRVVADAEVLPGGMSEGGIGAAIMDARLSDGRKLINMPEMVTFLAGLARQTYGETALIPGSEVAAIETREAEIRKVMREDISRYYREKNAKGQTMEQELSELMGRKAGKKRSG